MLEPTISTYNAYATAAAARTRAADRPRAGHPAARRRRAATSSPPARCSGTAATSRRSPTARCTRRPTCSSWRARSASTSSTSPTCARTARERALFEAALAAGAGARRPAEGPRRRRRPGRAARTSSRSYRAPQGRAGPDGLLRPDRAGAPAGRASTRSWGESEREKYRVVLLDEYQDTSVAQARMLSALFSGPDADRGRGHPVTAVGRPQPGDLRRGGAPRSPTSSASARDFPAASGEAETYPLTVNRRSDARILEVANALADPLYAATPEVRAARGTRRRGARRGRRRRARDLPRRAGLAGPGGAGRAPATPGLVRARGALARDRRAVPRQRPRRRRLRRPHRARRAGRDRRPLRTAPPARGGRGRRHPRPADDLGANADAAHRC